MDNAGAEISMLVKKARAPYGKELDALLSGGQCANGSTQIFDLISCHRKVLMQAKSLLKKIETAVRKADPRCVEGLKQDEGALLIQISREEYCIQALRECLSEGR